jgi:hypothetical protein
MTPEELQAAEDRFKRLLEEARAPWSLRIKLIVGGCIAALLVLAAVAFWPAKPIHEDVAPAPMVRQADQSVIAERAPDAHPPAARHIIPRGYVEERRETITVAPAPAASSVEVDLSLVRKGDERRVIASSPDGTVVSAIDIPIEPALIPPPPLKWAAGLGYTTQREVGVWVERDIGRLRVGAEVLKGAGAPRAEIRIGVAF